jgi:hypothetical protein
MGECQPGVSVARSRGDVVQQRHPVAAHGTCAEVRTGPTTSINAARNHRCHRAIGSLLTICLDGSPPHFCASSMPGAGMTSVGASGTARGQPAVRAIGSLLTIGLDGSPPHFRASSMPGAGITMPQGLRGLTKVRRAQFTYADTNANTERIDIQKHRPLGRCLTRSECHKL